MNVYTGIKSFDDLLFLADYLKVDTWLGGKKINKRNWNDSIYSSLAIKNNIGFRSCCNCLAVVYQLKTPTLIDIKTLKIQELLK